MALVASENSTKREWINAPQGLHKGVICDVQDLGEILNKKFNKMQHKCLLMIQLEPRMEPTEDEIAKGKPGRRHLISKRFTVSLAQNSELLPFVQGVLNRPLTEDEKSGGYDLESLIGRNVLCQVIHQPDEQDKEKIWANIQACLPNPAGEEMEIEDYIPKAQRENADGTPAAGQAKPQSTPAENSLELESTRYRGLTSLCRDLHIPYNEFPASVTGNAAMFKKCNDALQAAVEKKQAEVKAQQQQLREQQAAQKSSEAEGFDPLAAPGSDIDDRETFGDDDDDKAAADFDPLAAAAPAAEPEAAATPEPAAAAKPAANKTTGEALAKGRADRAATESANALDSGDDGKNPFADQVGTTPEAAASGGAQGQVEAETAGMPDKLKEIATKLANDGVDISGFNTNKAILAAVNEFRASTNKKPIDSMDKLTAAAMSTVLARLNDGTIEV